ncbi:DUF6777 domain-containing protein, partial [Kitasatospora paracochleata]|uniref:DUF6777 domain-containing protein n=1 Tax=Kitasatospora paracochleata TaxID=58354 RepID=UPI0031D11929
AGLTAGTGAVPGGATPLGAAGGGGASEPPVREVPGAGGGGRPPWWRNPRILAVAAGVIVAGVVLGVVLTSQSSTNSSNQASGQQQVALQPVAATGQDPFTGSVAAEQPASSAYASPAGATPYASPSGTLSGGDAGLYGGSQKVASCDVPKLSGYLAANPDKAQAWAGVEGIQPNTIDAYLKGLTPVVLRADTRVTNHGYSNGQATPYQAVLQSGTAVLVDSYGVPRVRCACGNPLKPPADTGASTSYSGSAWSSFSPDHVVTVTPAPKKVDSMVLIDPKTGKPFTRPVGGTGQNDTSASPSAPASGGSSSHGPSSGSSSGSGSGSPGGPSSKLPGSQSPKSGGQSGASSASSYSAGVAGPSSAAGASSYGSPAGPGSAPAQ